MTLTGDVFLFFIGLLALILMGMSNRNILFASASSFLWFVLLAWLFIGDAAVLGLDENWKVVLFAVFIILVFTPWLLRMDTEIRNEARGQRWSTWGAAPKTKGISGYEAYRAELRRRLGRR